MRDIFTNPGSSAAPRGERNARIGMRNGLLVLLCSIILAIGLTACPSQNHHVVSSSPNITSLNPNAGAVAAPVTIAGTNFGATQGTSTVTFNGTSATPTSWSATSIAVQVPAGATTGSVVVTVSGQASNGVTFTVTVAGGPTITNLNPSSGPVATPVTITGTNFGATQGTSTVTFNGTSATPTSWSATSIAAPVPAGATTGNVVVTVSGQASNGVNFTVGSNSQTADVATWHYDISRSGLNPSETTLTPTNVKSTTFGKVGQFTVDGSIDGQILYLSQLAIPGVGTKNVVYFATENDSVYAIDADSITGTSATVLWKKSTLLSGETTATGLPCGNIVPSGILATPVIDRSRNAIYVIANSENSAHTFFHRIHALDLTTGDELFGGPTTIAPTSPSQSGTVTFDPSTQHDRGALLESGNTIYTVWSGLDGDCGTYYAWVIGFSADTLAQTRVLNLTPDVKGAGIWLGGGGAAADSAGSIYAITGNGFGTTGPSGNDYPNSFVRLSASGVFSVADFFAPDNTITDDADDLDFGSAGPLLLPDLVDTAVPPVTHHLAVGAGKDGVMYVLNRDNMGQYNSMNNTVYQQFPLAHANFSTPVYFNNTVYVGPAESAFASYSITNAKLAMTPSTVSAHVFSFFGPVASISSNGTTNGIVWALDVNNGILFAYDATNLANEFYDSTQAAGSRDSFAPLGSHFITPMVSNGKVYFGTGTTIVVFGLLAP
jgi:IPT/TIG domain